MVKILSSTDDVLTLTTSGFYECMSYDPPENLPSGASGSGVLIIFGLDTYRRILVYIAATGSSYKRTYWDSSWASDWLAL